METTECHEDMTVTTNEVAKVIKGLKLVKVVGPDNVDAEALMHSNTILHYLLGVCFSAMLIHGYLPQGLMDKKDYTISKKTNVVNCQTKITIGLWHYQILRPRYLS